MGKVTLWWDMDSCPLPPHMDPFLVRSMASTLLENLHVGGSGVGHQFCAYKYPSVKEDDIELEQTLFNSEIRLQLVQPALAGKSDEIEKMIMADVLLWAMDVPPPGDIIFIIGNVDFSYVFQKLRERSYNVFLVCASVAQMPSGMLSAANECLGWLTFLNLLQQYEEKSQFPSSGQGWAPEHYQTLSNAYSRSPSPVSSKEWEEYPNRSGFGFVPENLFTAQPSFDCGWDSSQFSIPPLDEGATSTATVQQPHLFSAQPSFDCGWDSSQLRKQPHSFTAQPSFDCGRDSSQFSIPPLHEAATSTATGLQQHSFTAQPYFDCDWDSGQFSIPPLNEAATSTASVQQPQVAGFQGHSTKCTENPMDPAGNKHRNRKPFMPTGPKNKLASMNQFKAWLRQAVNSKENENGYNISTVSVDFQKATGKNLDLKFLGFLKIINLLEQCKDVADVKEVKKGCHLAFPVKTNKPKPDRMNKPIHNPKPVKVKPENSPCEVNPNPNLQPDMKPKPMKVKTENSPCEVNPNPNLQPDLKPKPKRVAEAEQKSMPKASMGDFHYFLLQMVSTGEFSQGFLMSQLRNKFESVSGKCLDLQHLGYRKLSNLVELYGSLVSVTKTGPEPERIYPAYLVSESIPSSNSRSNKEISTNIDYPIAMKKVKTEVYRTSSSGSDQKPENNESLLDQNSELTITESEWPSVSTESEWPSVSFSWPSMTSTHTEPKAPDFQGCSNKSDSSGTPRGSQVSGQGGQFPNVVSELSSHGDSHLPEDSENLRTMAESLQNLTFKRGNKSDCKEAITVSEPPEYQKSSCGISFGRELPGFVSSQLESLPSLDQKTICNIPSSPLQCLPQDSVVCSNDLQYDANLNCEQKEQNTKSALNDETNVKSIVSPAESIMQVAGRGLKTICDFSMWKMNQ